MHRRVDGGVLDSAAMAVRAAQRPMSTRGTPDPILPGHSRTPAHTVRRVAHVDRSLATGHVAHFSDREHAAQGAPKVPRALGTVPMLCRFPSLSSMTEKKGQDISAAAEKVK